MLRQGLSNGIQLGMWPFQWLVNAHFKSYIEIRRLEIWLSRCLVNNKAGFFRRGKLVLKIVFFCPFPSILKWQKLKLYWKRICRNESSPSLSVISSMSLSSAIPETEKSCPVFVSVFFSPSQYFQLFVVIFPLVNFDSNTFACRKTRKYGKESAGI